MNLDFASKDLREVCETEKIAKKKLGAPAAKKLKSRLADIVAVERVGDLKLGKPHPLTGDRLGQFSITLHGGIRLVFEPLMDDVPTTKDGSIAWPEVTGVNILFIGDYHD